MPLIRPSALTLQLFTYRRTLIEAVIPARPDLDHFERFGGRSSRASGEKREGGGRGEKKDAQGRTEGRRGRKGLESGRYNWKSVGRQKSRILVRNRCIS